MAIPLPVSHCDAVQLAIWSAESPIYNPYRLEYAWYEPYKLQLDRIFPTCYGHGRNGDSSITVSPQYWLLLPNAPGIFNPHHAGAQIPDFLLLYTKFTSSLRNALHSKIPLLNVELKNKPTFITQQSQFKICRKQALQQASRAPMRVALVCYIPLCALESFGSGFTSQTTLQMDHQLERTE